MDTMNASVGTGETEVGGTAVTQRRLPRLLLFGALICFALPFLTVTCYGETTVSGVQAASSFDLYPGDGGGERELVRDEGANGFALIALVATVAALVSTFRGGARQPAVWAAVAGAIALQAFFLYAYHRTMGNAFPRIGLVGALVLLVAGAWAGVGRVPQWVAAALCGLALVMLPGALLPVDDVYESGWVYLPVMLGGIAAVMLAVGAMPEAGRPHDAASRPTTVRMAIAGIVALVILAVAMFAAYGLLLAAFSGSSDPTQNVGEGYLFAIVTVAANVAAGLGAWAAGRAITRPQVAGTALAPTA